MRKTLSTIVLILLVSSCNSNTQKDVSDTIHTYRYANHLQTDGQIIYEDFCVSCHLPDGQGVPKAFPPLAKSDYLKNNQKASLRGIKYGMSDEIIVNGITYNGVMPPMGLTDKEVAEVMNYINNAWGNSFGEIVTETDVSKITK